MKRLYLFVISATVFTVLLLVSLFVVSCNKPDPGPSASGIIGTWFLEDTGDHEDMIQTILTINEDGTMIIKAFSSIDAPDDSDNQILALWQVKGGNLEIDIPGIEDEDDMDDQDYELCKFKVEDDCLLLCADGIWYLFSKVN